MTINDAGRELPEHTSLAAVADVAFDRIAALVRQVIRVPVALVSLVDRDGQVFPGQSGLPAPYSESRATPLTHSFCQHVVRTESPLVVSDARLDPMLHTNLAIPDLGVIGYAGIPLVDLDGTVVGSLCAIDTEPHDWTDAELTLLNDLAATCSAELQLRSAAMAAAAAEARTKALLDLSVTLSNTLTVSEVSQAVSRLSTTRLGAAFGGVTVLDPVRETLTYVDLSALPTSVHGSYRAFPLSEPTPSAAAVVERRNLFFETVEEMAERFPEAAAALGASGHYAAVYLPLRLADRILGTLAMLWVERRTFNADDRALLGGLSSYTAQAVERALLLADRREVAETLQAAMLPTLPTVDWLELAGRYLPARVADAVGGDWYDAFFRSADELAISVGDVEGHDTVAAAAMGHLRSTLRGLTTTLPGDPSDLLESVDRVLTALPIGRYATGILGTLTRHDAGVSLAWSNAGHPAPLLIEPGCPPVFLDRPASRPLGLRLGLTPRTTHHLSLAPGSTLLMFTDGLVERRYVELEDTLRALRSSAGRHRDLALPDLVDGVLHDMVDTRHDDDVVVFGVRVPLVAVPPTR